jgi:hypothetical protein
MQMENYHVQYTNGTERRSTVFAQPSIEFAAMAAQRWASEAFSGFWNQVADRSKWKIVVISEDGERHEELAAAYSNFTTAVSTCWHRGHSKVRRSNSGSSHETQAR